MRQTAFYNPYSANISWLRRYESVNDRIRFLQDEIAYWANVIRARTAFDKPRDHLEHLMVIRLNELEYRQAQLLSLR